MEQEPQHELGDDDWLTLYSMWVESKVFIECFDDTDPDYPMHLTRFAGLSELLFDQNDLFDTV